MRIFLFLIALFLVEIGFSQNPFFVAIDKTSGLPSNSVYDIFQDSKGFMWFATGKGLCRYDGNNFKIFTADFQTSKSGSCIAEDRFGRIWYENFDGFLYYVENGIIKALNQKNSLGYFRYGIIKDELFLIQSEAVFIYDLKTLQLKTKHSIKEKKIKFCYATKDKFYVLGNYLYEFDSFKKVVKFNLPLNFKTDIEGTIISFWNKKLLINSKNNNNYYVFENNSFSKNTLTNDLEFTQNTAITDNTLWLCTPNGVYKNNLISNQSRLLFENQNISFVFKDKNNNYWISTLDKGLMFIQDFENNYINIKPKPISLSLGKNSIYIGFEKELIYKLNYKNLEISKIYETKNNHSISQIFADTIGDNVFFNSFKFNILNKNNKISNEYKIAIKDIVKVDEKYFSFAASSVSGIFCSNKNLKSQWDFLFDKNKDTNFSGFNQAFLINNSNGKSTEFNAANNTIYYATNIGLVAITPEGKINEIKYQNKTLYLTRIQKHNDFIVGLSSSEKLFIINAKNEVSKFKLPNTIVNEKFNKFFIQGQYCYLFSTNSVYEYNFKTQTVQIVMSISNDLEISDVILKNNQLFFATSKGIVIKNRNEIGNYPQPKLIIDGIYINEKIIEIDQLKELNPDENDITINFSTLSFLPNVNYIVSYKINNLNWKTLESNEKNLKLSSLSSGKYNIILAINYKNKKVEFKNIEFEIKKSFWLNPIMLICLAIFLLAVMYLFYKWQINKIERQNLLQLERVNLENKLNQSKLTAIKSQMNPHFFYNALNTIQSFILSNDKKQAVNYLSKFSTLTRTILEMTEKENISIADEIATMKLYLDIEKARFNEDFEYEIIVENDTDLEFQKIPSMFLQPFIENAVKHGLLHKNGLKKLTIKFFTSQNIVKIKIDDNGIGRQKSSELNVIKNKNHTSFATNAMQNRIELLNKNKKNKITINFIDKINTSQQSLGTTVVIEIPLN